MGHGLPRHSIQRGLRGVLQRYAFDTASDEMETLTAAYPRGSNLPSRRRSAAQSAKSLAIFRGAPSGSTM